MPYGSRIGRVVSIKGVDTVVFCRHKDQVCGSLAGPRDSGYNQWLCQDTSIYLPRKQFAKTTRAYVGCVQDGLAQIHSRAGRIIVHCQDIHSVAAALCGAFGRRRALAPRLCHGGTVPDYPGRDGSGLSGNEAGRAGDQKAGQADGTKPTITQNRFPDLTRRSAPGLRNRASGEENCYNNMSLGSPLQSG